MAYTVMLDAGHGGKDPGAVYNGRNEKDDALRLTMAIGEILKENGINVEYTRTTDVYDTPYQKAMKANESGADFFVSLHRNSYPQANAVSGVEVLVYDKSGVKNEMAEEIADQLETVGYVNLGVKARPNLVVLRRTKMPALLVEAGFINSDTDNELFDQNFDATARAIADGILSVLEENTENEAQKRYRVQTGAFRNPANAERMLNELLEEGYFAEIYEQDGYFLVQVGDESNLTDAAALERRLKRDGYATVIVT